MCCFIPFLTNEINVPYLLIYIGPSKYPNQEIFALSKNISWFGNSKLSCAFVPSSNISCQSFIFLEISWERCSQCSPYCAALDRRSTRAAQDSIFSFVNKTNAKKANRIYFSTKTKQIGFSISFGKLKQIEFVLVFKGHN